MNNKKLKDLRKGDKVWLWSFTDTTPIQVDKAKREGELMCLTIRWDDAIFECFGPALGFTCIGYNRKFGQELMFTCSYDLSHKNEQKIQRVRNLLPKLKELYDKIEEI